MYTQFLSVTNRSNAKYYAKYAIIKYSNKAYMHTIPKCFGVSQHS